MSDFVEDINYIKREILDLKTQYQRKMSQLKTREYSITLDFTFHNGLNESDNAWSVYASSASGKIGIISYRLEANVDSNIVWGASADKRFIGGLEYYLIPVYVAYSATKTYTTVKLVITSTTDIEIEAYNDMSGAPV